MDDGEEIIGTSHVVDSHLFARPQRFARPDKIVLILRGLPGAGKTCVAKNIEIHEKKFRKTVKIFTYDEYFEEVRVFKIDFFF